MPKGIETFIKLRDGGMVAARLCTSAGRQMSSERIKIQTVPAIPFINQLCIWTKKSGKRGVWYIQMRDIGVYFVRQSIGWL